MKEEIKETLITFQVAILAKEKEFNERTTQCFTLDGQKKNLEELWSQGCEGGMGLDDWKVNYNLPHFNLIARPTQSLLQKWLREVHNIHICNNLHYKVNGGIAGYLIDISHPNGDFKSINISENTYEEALEKGLYEALKLI